jgi:poly(A) polymerase
MDQSAFFAHSSYLLAVFFLINNHFFSFKLFNLFLLFMHFEFTDNEQAMIQLVGSCADELQLEAYLIGGFVRDKLLQRNCKDLDFVCVGDGIAWASKVAEKLKPQPSVSIFRTFGTAQIKTEGFELEFVGARKESYASHSRKPDVETGTIEDDQRRRDFTINALAIAVNKNNFGALVDPFKGVEDLGIKIIRTPLQPAQTFSDDPLRMMRAIRFASQLDFSIHPETWLGIIETAERIKIVSKERIADELNKIILSKKPSVGFDLLYRSGLLKLIFPQMVDLAGAEYVDGKGHKDNFYHTIQVLDNIAANTDDLWLRWAAVLHDIGKPPTKRFEEGHGWTFHGHEVVGARMVPKIFNCH